VTCRRDKKRPSKTYIFVPSQGGTTASVKHMKCKDPQELCKGKLNEKLSHCYNCLQKGLGLRLEGLGGSFKLVRK